MFRRKADAAVAQPAEEASATTLTAEPEAEGDTAAAGCCPAADAPEGSEDATGGEAAAESGAGEAAQGAAAEGVEIPKQQSAGEAADNEAGEGARK
ncbi:hypothetical protein [Streptomyces sp. NBC_00083]|uniref:hypothetical protein n=1 Tax=Streptomyces sp. NBC_00083 TaxID=2975647 RepID=UPI00224FE871|nr:hypothetical protein [Streptomyces sp. NBC_00083]MCX5386094.1 hypothetical protein [Streptomyces sp. NBC_00083]